MIISHHPAGALRAGNMWFEKKLFNYSMIWSKARLELGMTSLLCKVTVIGLVSLLFAVRVEAQVYVGLKVGANIGKSVYENETYKKYHNSDWAPGFSGGFVLNIEKKKKYGLAFEMLYSSKGRAVNSTANDYQKNDATYSFLDFPVLFRYYFNQRHSRWYINAGPELNWWLSGKGYVDVYDQEQGTITYDYKINFGEPEGSYEYMNVTDPRRIQVSVGVGAGFQWALKNSDYIGVDIRASLGQTYWGPYDGGEIPSVAIKDNFQFTNNLIILSVVYVIDPIGNQRHERKY